MPLLRPRTQGKRLRFCVDLFRLLAWWGGAGAALTATPEGDVLIPLDAREVIVSLDPDG